MADGLRGRVQTVLGPVSPDSLGVTLPHEHMFYDFTSLLTSPNIRGNMVSLLNPDSQIYLKVLGKIRQYPYSATTNLIMDVEEEVIEELKLFKQAGGGALCDVAVTGVRVKPQSLPQISRESGVHIVCGTGYYVDPFLSEEVKMMAEEELTMNMVKEIREGIDNTDVKCGVIGEIGCSWPLTDNEQRVLRAAANAQRETGAPLIIHPGRGQNAPFQILDILEQSGADISHTVMAHLDRTILDDDVLLKFAKRGCYLEYDLFGTECSHYQLDNSSNMPSDAQRIQKVKLLIDNDYTHRVLISQDIHTKHRLVRYGGHGYGHILEYVAPKMEDRGIPADVVKTIITNNPNHFFTFM